MKKILKRVLRLFEPTERGPIRPAKQIEMEARRKERRREFGES